MRDTDIERLFERVGDTARPGAEFEEDLLLRLEARMRDELEAEANLGSSSTPLAPAIEVEFNRERAGRSPRRPLLAVAAGVVAVAGLAGLFVAVRPPPADPVTTLPNITTPLSAPQGRRGLSDVCTRHAERLSEIDAMGAPLDNEVPSDERLAILNELAGIVDEHLVAATAAVPKVDQSIIEELTALERDLSNELVFIDRGRTDGARYVIPTAVSRLLAVNEQLANEGGTTCE